MTADYSIFERFGSAKSAAFSEARVKNQPFFTAMRLAFGLPYAGA
jgi:hypothetical protein